MTLKASRLSGSRGSANRGLSINTASERPIWRSLFAARPRRRHLSSAIIVKHGRRTSAGASGPPCG
jgi:hypothetical protein